MRRPSPRLRFAIAACVVLALLAGACGRQSAAPTASFSTYITEPEHLFPPNSNESEGNAVLQALFTGLVRYDTRTSEPYNAMAESIQTDDFVKWTIRIKDGWTFHNGEPVTAESYVDAWNYAAFGPNAQQNSSFFTDILGYDDLNPQPATKGAPPPPPKADKMRGLRVIDQRTFEVTLAKPFSQWSLRLGYPGFSPLPKVAFQNPSAFEQSPIGNGPFMMDGSWDHNVIIRTKAYPNYQGKEKPKAGGVDFKIYGDVNTAYNDLLAGTLDIVDSLPPGRATEAKRTFSDRYAESPLSSYNYLGFPLYLPQFQKKELRYALSLAINRKEITDKIFEGGRTPAQGFIAPTIPGYRDGSCRRNTAYDPQRAKQLFDQAGGWQGTMFIWFNRGAGHDKWAEAVANYWRTHLGIQDIKFVDLPFSEYLPKMDQKGATGPFRLGWGMDYPSPQNFLEPLYTTGAFAPTGSNTTFYSNPQFDDLVMRGNQQKTLADSIPYYQQAEDVLCEDMPTIPMFYGLNQFAWSNRVDNVYVDGFGDINYSEISVKR